MCPNFISIVIWTTVREFFSEVKRTNSSLSCRMGRSLGRQRSLNTFILWMFIIQCLYILLLVLVLLLLLHLGESLICIQLFSCTSIPPIPGHKAFPISLQIILSWVLLVPETPSLTITPFFHLVLGLIFLFLLSSGVHSYSLLLHLSFTVLIM